MMWRLALTLTLCCWGSEATVTCKDNNDGEVDWFILYKAPGEKITGTQRYKNEMRYFYTDSSQTVSRMEPGTHGYKNLNDPSGALANTLRPILKKIRDMPANFGFISYSDQPPGCNAHNDFGHSKGVLMVEQNSFGVWLLHSTPQFPFRRDQNNFWPESGIKNAQTFICVTFQYDQFSNIGTHLKYIGAFPFEHYIPDEFHRELIDATKWVQAPPPSTYQTLRSKGGQRFHSIAKQQVKLPGPGQKRPKLIDGDLYYTIAQLTNSEVYVQTWGCQKNRESSYCLDPLHKVHNIEMVKKVLGIGSQWKPSSDHSKWCVAKSSSKPWTCIADVNRAETQYERRGGALCIENLTVRNKFLEFAGATEDCTTSRTPVIMDIDPDCDPDPDHGTDIRTDPSVIG